MNSTGSWVGTSFGSTEPLVRWERFGVDLHKPFITFVQLGANAGKDSHDPLWPYASACANWRGLALEPTRSNFVKLCENCAS